jgi:transposase InsO family protein
MNLHSRARTCPASRALMVARMESERWTASDAAAAVGVTRKTASKWRSRFRSEGPSGLRDRSSRPHHSPRRLDSGWEKLILELRRTRKTILQIAQALGLDRSRVARVLRRHGLSRLGALEPPVPVRRYEWARPGDMLHLDVKKLGRIEGGPGHRVTGDRREQERSRGAGWEYVHVCVDDASRVAYVEVLEDELGITTAGFLRRAVAYYQALGIRVRRVLTDNGSPYMSKAFAHACVTARTKHRRTRPYTPRTNGKAERFIQSLLRECAYNRPFFSSAERRRGLRAWVQHYNGCRIHSALGTTPLARLASRTSTTS